MFSSLKRTALLLSVILPWIHLNAAEPDLVRQQIEKDLALQATLKSSATIQAGERVDVGLVLRNRSSEKSHAIVLPGDGSEAGWREPYVHFTATIDTGTGISKPVPVARYSRCGLFDFDWQKDARTLKPGEELTLKDWLTAPSATLEFQEAGRVRLVAHYSYRAGVVGRSANQKAVTGLMAGIPAFEVVSAPVEFDVVRPLDLVLTVKAPLTIKTKAKISELLDIRLVNRSQKPIEVSSPTLTSGTRLLLTIEGQVGWFPSINTQRTTSGEKMVLKPGEGVAVLGAGSFANGLDGTWEYPMADTIKVRATFLDSTSQLGTGVLSNWAEIRALESKVDPR